MHPDLNGLQLYRSFVNARIVLCHGFGSGILGAPNALPKKFGLHSAGWPMQAEGVVLNVAKDCIIRWLTVGAAGRGYHGQNELLISPFSNSGGWQSKSSKIVQHGDRIHHGAVNTSPPLAVAMTGITEVLPTV